MDVDANMYKAAQLRQWLRHLELPTSGTKSTLILRLNEVPFEQRGECPVDENVEEQEAEEEREIDVHEEVEASNEQTASKELIVEERDVSNYKKEIDLLKREKQLLERENNLLKRMTELAEQSSTAASIPNAANSHNMCTNLKDLLPEYDGTSSVDVWVSQLKSLGNVYSADENTLQALMMSKLRGKAQSWLHSKPCFASESLTSLLNEMSTLFGCKESKLFLRRKFEDRRWKAGEKFAEYFNDKLILSNNFDVGEDEIIDYIVEGIPDERLRTQAYLQCYTTKSQLLQAFSKVTLQQRGILKQQSATDSKMRCFNCNSFGHLAAECKKPKREWGACYGCGSLTHRIAACPNRKQTIQYLEQNDYNVS